MWVCRMRVDSRTKCKLACEILEVTLGNAELYDGQGITQQAKMDCLPCVNSAARAMNVCARSS